MLMKHREHLRHRLAQTHKKVFEQELSLGTHKKFHKQIRIKQGNKLFQSATLKKKKRKLVF